ncbi:MAG: SRPBCC family protein [Chloroflexi bacterium]|nr:SRPBCC family protein [Chloroflexota bacterium]
MSATAAEYRSFVKSSFIRTSLDRLTRFHEDPRALAKLTPPPIIMQLHSDARRSITEGEIEFTLWLGPLPIRWIARHEPGPSPHSFADLQIKGPMAYWRHEHIFTEKPGGVELTDRIILAHRSGLAGRLTRLFFDGLPLRLLFAYRHRRTRMATQLK